MTSTTATLIGIFASFLIARLLYTGRRKNFKRTFEIGTAVFLIACISSFWWTHESVSAPVVQNSTGSINSNRGIVAPGATASIMQAIAPNGIAAIQSTLINPSVKNYGPPPATLSFKEKVIARIANTQLLQIIVTTDRPIPAAHIGFLFSGPFNESKAFFHAHPPTIAGYPMQSLAWSYPLQHLHTLAPFPNSIGVHVNLPSSFDPNQKLILTVETMRGVHLFKFGQFQ